MTQCSSRCWIDSRGRANNSGSAQAASNQHRDHRVIAQLTQGRRRSAVKKTPTLLRSQPVPEAHADPSHPLHAPDACRQFRTQEAGVGRFVGHPPNRGEPQVNCGRRIPELFEVNPIPEHNPAVESETGRPNSNR
jgi:hypothetical protein